MGLLVSRKLRTHNKDFRPEKSLIKKKSTSVNECELQAVNYSSMVRKGHKQTSMVSRSFKSMLATNRVITKVTHCF